MQTRDYVQHFRVSEKLSTETLKSFLSKATNLFAFLDQWDRPSVTRFGEILLFGQDFRSLGQKISVYFAFGKMLTFFGIKNL